MEAKVCKKCQTDNRSAKGVCKTCNQNRQKAYRKAHPEKMAELSKKYRDRNAEKISIAKKKCRLARPEHIKAIRKIWHEQNKDRVNEERRELRKSNPNIVRLAERKIKLRKSYEMTIGDFEGLMADQHCLCAICKTDLERPCVDHDHKTGDVRGILCHKCNLALGGFNDDIDTLQEAANYLRSHTVISNSKFTGRE
jgi:hypothetical protein